MGEINSKRDLEYHSIEIITDEPRGLLVVVKFKSDEKDRLGREHSWCPTLAELAFLYRTTKIMKRSTSKIQPSKT
ncbi:MAG: hypothetical protein JW840_05030 [Candidatus Thermoplasmatota archaeon]|nr:hypothetical protein [Candidatus Thermoplasmatota archaeon]